MAYVILVVLLPVIREAFLRAIPLEEILFAFIALPLALNATFTSGIVTGRQAVRWYAAVNMAYPIVTTALIILILGGLGPSVTGAIAVYLIASLIQTIGFAIGARRSARTKSGAATCDVWRALPLRLAALPREPHAILQRED